MEDGKSQPAKWPALLVPSLGPVQGPQSSCFPPAPRFPSDTGPRGQGTNPPALQGHSISYCHFTISHMPAYKTGIFPSLFFSVLGIQDEEGKVPAPSSSVYSLKGLGLILMLFNDIVQVPGDRQQWQNSCCKSNCWFYLNPGRIR